jgi:hypothetical protein
MMPSFTPAEIIRQRRQQMLIHSHLYYRMDAPIISDDQWQRWADELAQLQRQHPEPINFYDREFADWDGSTGMHLPNDGWVIEKADLVRRLHAGDHQRPDAEKTPPAPAMQAPATPPPMPPAQFSLL